ncbi:MAG: carbohydrate binding family 9 domain-containing protein [Deltaproteobacteria bacterium]|nr:carbohydrate binding family 9 domain-containing protein [Deltaproteobacteria bacterium]
MLKRTWALLLALTSCLSLASLSGAAEEPPLAQAVLVSEAPTIDGYLDDPAWRQAFKIEDFTQVVPVTGAEPSERTLVYVARDEQNLYLGIRCYVRDPSTILAKRMQRDDSLFYDDRFAIVLDTFHDRRNGYFFQINPIGGRRDAIFEGEVFMVEWDGIWHAEARIDEKGWVAELAIPFQTLSYDPETDTWGLNLLRGIRRDNERTRWADPTLNRSFMNMSHAGILEGMRGISQGLGLDIKPYLSLGYEDDPDKDKSKVIAEPGGDIAYKLTPSLTATVTANTDFAETEIDEAQSTVTRFALFFPEKRDFFLQDAGIFEFADLQHKVVSPDGDTDANARPFFSRKIGLTNDGKEPAIHVGGKLTGRIGRFNLGLLDVQLEDHGDVRSRNLAVGRVAMNLLGESKLGAIVTNGDPNSNDDNTLVGTDFNHTRTTW